MRTPAKLTEIDTSPKGVTDLPGIGNSTHGKRLLTLIGTALADLVTHAKTAALPHWWAGPTPAFGHFGIS